MKRYIALLLAALLALALTACGGNHAASESTEPQPAQQTAPASAEAPATPAETPAQQAAEPAPTAEPQTADAEKTLVVYFSATGTTKGVAERLASVTGADIYEIVPAEPYTAEDLNYNDKTTRATREQNDKSVRPQIVGEPLSLDSYATIYVGYPIWWGEEPRILDTFAESYDFSGKTMIPFCTSGGSGIGSSGKNLEKLTGGATWLDGKRFSGSVSEADLQAWADGLK